MTDQTTTAATDTPGDSSTPAATAAPADTTATGADGGGQQQGAQTTAATDQAATGAPEAYAFNAPEGTALDEAVTGAFGEVAKELNLTQDGAQKVLDKVLPVMAARAADQVAATKAGWLAASKADKEIGGQKFTENLGIAKTARDAFASPELIKLLDESGLSDHPEFIRMFHKAGKAMSEETFVGGRQASATSTAQSFYGASNMNP